jgi:hypothetical protein
MSAHSSLGVESAEVSLVVLLESSLPFEWISLELLLLELLLLEFVELPELLGVSLTPDSKLSKRVDVLVVVLSK